MSDFEREIVHCLNDFFKTHHIQGFAYRHRQQPSANGHTGVLVDSPNPSYHLSIECKSIIDKKLYFSQHFHTNKNKIHRVDVISDFLNKSGRTGFLAAEFRQGPGNTCVAFLIPWKVVVDRFRATKGITIDDARSYIVLARSGNGYLLESLNAK